VETQPSGIVAVALARPMSYASYEVEVESYPPTAGKVSVNGVQVSAVDPAKYTFEIAPA
jgi:hypothetical protein